jgi:hypothetical protein
VWPSCPPGDACRQCPAASHASWECPITYSGWFGAPCPGFDAAGIELRDSKGGKYVGITITINATSREQLDELYRTLSSHPMAKVVL